MMSLKFPAFWSIPFYLMLFCAACSYCAAICESQISTIVDVFPKLKEGKRETIARGVYFLVLALISFPFMSFGQLAQVKSSYFLFNVITCKIKLFGTFLFLLKNFSNFFIMPVVLWFQLFISLSSLNVCASAMDMVTTSLKLIYAECSMGPSINTGKVMKSI